ncbi:MAG: DNA-3-methyladenine glycosylase 2 family protein, partial [Clostridia bacterium]|nr:DNA-3-methyladenine glycosylase 2 family protein [Clostridia bacterium]
FRFDPVSFFVHKQEWGGVAFGRYVVFAQDREDELYIYNSDALDFENIWCIYLDFLIDYQRANEKILEAVPSEHMERCVKYGSGIRLLCQSLWECMISFIISQNNNIPRIKKIISALSEKYGEKIEFMGGTYYAFPEADVLAKATVEELFQLKMGFRAKYVYDACRFYLKETDKIFSLGLSSLEDDIETLCQVKGIGLKVASCILLFSSKRRDAFPIDVHMKRTLEKYFKDGFDVCALGEHAGLAQQYLFYYEKYNKALE